ncbi:MAG: hypothetical protein ABIN83_00600 [Sphingomicrobium sp.]
MSLVTLVPDLAPGKPPPPVLPSKIADKKVTAHESFSAELDPTLLGAAGGCATFDLIAKSLIAEPTVVTAVLMTPQERRSIADAVVIWNVGWSDAAGSLNDPLGPARAVIEQNLRSIPEDCLDEVVVGPRLVPIPEGDRTMFLAIGSGSWTWRQLLTKHNPALPGDPAHDWQSASPWDWLTSRAPTH